jgi:hypothetical protein
VGIVATGTIIVLIAFQPPVAAMVAASALAGIVLSNVLVSYITLRTTLSPDDLLGRVGSTARTLSVGLMPLGALSAGILLDLVGGATTLLLMGAASAATGVLFAFMPRVRRARVPRRSVAAS